MAPRLTYVLGLCGLVATSLGACDSYDDVAFSETSLPKARTGARYEHQLAVTRAVEGAGFFDCRIHNEETESVGLEVSRDGKLTFTPTKRGDVEVCVRYGNDDTYEIARLVSTVTVGFAEGESPEELTSKREAFRQRIAAIKAAALAVAEPKPEACPSDLPKGKAHAYDEAYLGIIADEGHLTSATKTTNAFTPPGAMLWGNAITEETASAFTREQIEAMVAPAYILVVRIGELTRPKDLGMDKFEPGSFRGHVQVVDVKSAKVHCAFPLAFASSAKIDFTAIEELDDRGNTVGSDVVQATYSAIEGDFRKSGHRALRKALSEHAAMLTFEP